MKRHIRTLVAMVMVIMMISCLMASSASAAYDPEIPSNAPASVGWTLYIGGDEYQVDSNAVVGWGSSGRNVYIVQIACNQLANTHYINCACGDADGVYGDNTNRGVKGIQSYCNNANINGTNRAVDGVVGEQTWNRFAYFLG